MYPDYVNKESLTAFIRSALNEDLGPGDFSSLSAIHEGRIATANLKIKESGVLAGVELAKSVFAYFDPSLQLEVKIADGEEIHPGDIGFTVTGPARSILMTERLVLNCMQRMSAIATHTRQLVTMIEGTGATILDTRKTTPCFRMLEKWAVLIGGGSNHRFGLFDKIMLKDNHVDIAGGVKNALRLAKDYIRDRNLNLAIEIETRNLKEVAEALEEGGAETIMLDNMTPAEMREAVILVNGRCKTEASGGITADTLIEVANTGVDFISVGALTHTIKSLDLSLKIVK